MPDLILINSGTHNNCRAWNNRITILLIYLTLNTVSTCTENGDKRIIRRFTSVISSHAVIQSISIIASQLTGINFLDDSVDFASYFCIGGSCLQLINLCLLAHLVIFVLLQIHLIRLNLNGIRKLAVLIGFLFLFLKSGNLLIKAEGFILQPVKSQLRFLQAVLDTAQVVFKKQLSLLYLISNLHLYFGNSPIVLNIYLYRLLRLYHACEPVQHSGIFSKKSADLSHICNFTRSRCRIPIIFFIVIPATGTSCSSKNDQPSDDKTFFLHGYLLYDNSMVFQYLLQL